MYSNLQKFAAAIDEFDTFSYFKLRDRGLLWYYFRGGDDTIQHTSSLSHLRNENVQKVKKFSHIMFRYRLLDILANLLEVPRHKSLAIIERQPLGNIPARLKDVSQFLKYCHAFLISLPDAQSHVRLEHPN
jgi:hypothetical protein